MQQTVVCVFRESSFCISGESQALVKSFFSSGSSELYIGRRPIPDLIYGWILWRMGTGGAIYRSECRVLRRDLRLIPNAPLYERYEPSLLLSFRWSHQQGGECSPQSVVPMFFRARRWNSPMHPVSQTCISLMHPAASQR